MSRMKTAALYFLLCVLCGTLYSQEHLTPAPIVLRPANPMAWKMTLANAATVPKSSPAGESAHVKQPVSLEYVLYGELMKVTLGFADGSHQDFWKAKDVYLCRDEKGTAVEVYSGERPRYPYASHGFYGIENVKPEHLKGISQLGGTPCQYFQGNRLATLLEHPVFPGDAEPIPELQYEAWFDVKSGLPKAYRAEGKTWLFEFLPAPPAPLSLPSEWQVALEKFRLDRRRAGLDR